MIVKRRILMLCLLLFMGVAACHQTDTDKNKTQVDKTNHKKYTCTMHPKVILDHPGVCPKCGMELVEADTVDDK
jgi:hypothetical protein